MPGMRTTRLEELKGYKPDSAERYEMSLAESKGRREVEWYTHRNLHIQAKFDGKKWTFYRVVVLSKVAAR